MPLVQQIPVIVSEVQISALTADGTCIIPALQQIISVVVRETAGKTMPFGLSISTTPGTPLTVQTPITANSLKSSLSVSSLNPGDAFSATVNTTIYLSACGRAISGITQANPAVVTYTGTDAQLANGQTIDLSGIVGMTELNGTQAVIANFNAGANTFELQGVDSTGFGAYVSGGVVSGWNGASVNATICTTLFT